MNDGSEIDVLMMPSHEISLDPLERWLNALCLRLHVSYMYYAVRTKKRWSRRRNDTNRSTCYERTS